VSETIASGRRQSKSTCRKCNRTVHLVTAQGVDGPVQVELDPELISIVVFEKRAAMVEFARRLHAERCDSYQQEAAKMKIAAERKIWDAKQSRRAARKPPSGAREPGQ
jgi:hypothetical protein